MRKVTVTVTIEKQLAMLVPDKFFSDELNIEHAEFYGDEWEGDRDRLVKQIAIRHARLDGGEHEGTGAETGGDYMKARSKHPESFVVVREVYEDCEAEIESNDEQVEAL